MNTEPLQEANSELKKDGIRLLCLNGSSYWGDFIHQWLNALTQGNSPSVVNGIEYFNVREPNFPAGEIVVIDTKRTNDPSWLIEISTADMIILFIQGVQNEKSLLSIDLISAYQRQALKTVPVMALIGLISDAGLEAIKERCQTKGLMATYFTLSSNRNNDTIREISRFARHISLQKNVLRQPGAASLSTITTTVQGDLNMSTINEALDQLMTLDGAMAVAIVDSASGMVMGKRGSGINLDAAAAGNTEVVRAKTKTMRALGLQDVIEDILITLGTQYHVIRPLGKKPAVFLYLVLDKNKANLGMARYRTMEIEGGMTFQ